MIGRVRTASVKYLETALTPKIAQNDEKAKPEQTEIHDGRHARPGLRQESVMKSFPERTILSIFI